MPVPTTFYEWDFTIGGRPLLPLGKKCHRGPMIDIEQVLSQPFTKSTAFLLDVERLRYLTLLNIVTTDRVEVQTREVILRVLFSPLGSVFGPLVPLKAALQTLICEKRNSIDVDADLVRYDSIYRTVAGQLLGHGLTDVQVALLQETLVSRSPILRVAARCAILLAATYAEDSL